MDYNQTVNGLAWSAFGCWLIYFFFAFIVQYRELPQGESAEAKAIQISHQRFKYVKHLFWLLSMLLSAGLLTASMKNKSDKTSQDWISAVTSGLAFLLAVLFYVPSGYFWEPVVLTLVSILNAYQIGLQAQNMDSWLNPISATNIGLCLIAIIVLSRQDADHMKSTAALSIVIIGNFLRIVI